MAQGLKKTPEDQCLNADLSLTIITVGQIKLWHRHSVRLLFTDKSYATNRCTNAKYICMLVSMAWEFQNRALKVKMGSRGKLTLTLISHIL